MPNKETESMTEYHFVVHAYRLEKDGKPDPNGVEAEYSKLITNTIVKRKYQLAYDTAVDYGKREGYFPTRFGYYGHYAVAATDDEIKSLA